MTTNKAYGKKTDFATTSPQPKSPQSVHGAGETYATKDHGYTPPKKMNKWTLPGRATVAPSAGSSGAPVTISTRGVRTVVLSTPNAPTDDRGAAHLTAITTAPLTTMGDDVDDISEEEDSNRLTINLAGVLVAVVLFFGAFLVASKFVQRRLKRKYADHPYREFSGVESTASSMVLPFADDSPLIAMQAPFGAGDSESTAAAAAGSMAGSSGSGRGASDAQITASSLHILEPNDVMLTLAELENGGPAVAESSFDGGSGDGFMAAEIRFREDAAAEAVQALLAVAAQAAQDAIARSQALKGSQAKYPAYMSAGNLTRATAEMDADEINGRAAAEAYWRTGLQQESLSASMLAQHSDPLQHCLKRDFQHNSEYTRGLYNYEDDSGSKTGSMYGAAEYPPRKKYFGRPTVSSESSVTTLHYPLHSSSESAGGSSSANSPHHALDRFPLAPTARSKYALRFADGIAPIPKMSLGGFLGGGQGGGQHILSMQTRSSPYGSSESAGSSPIIHAGGYPGTGVGHGILANTTYTPSMPPIDNTALPPASLYEQLPWNGVLNIPTSSDESSGSSPHHAPYDDSSSESVDRSSGTDSPQRYPHQAASFSMPRSVAQSNRPIAMAGAVAAREDPRAIKCTFEEAPRMPKQPPRASTVAAAAAAREKAAKAKLRLDGLTLNMFDHEDISQLPDIFHERYGNIRKNGVYPEWVLELGTKDRNAVYKHTQIPADEKKRLVRRARQHKQSIAHKKYRGRQKEAAEASSKRKRTGRKKGR